MMLSEDLYGSSLPDIEAAKSVLEPLLDCIFEARDSEHYAGLYYLATIGDREGIRIRHNLDPYDDEPAELDFPQYAVVVDVYDTDRPAYFQEKLESNKGVFTLLRHAEY